MILPLWQETRASQKNQIRPLVARLAKITVVVQPLPSTEIHEPLPLNMVDCLESNGKGKNSLYLISDRIFFLIIAF